MDELIEDLCDNCVIELCRHLNICNPDMWMDDDWPDEMDKARVDLVDKLERIKK